MTSDPGRYPPPGLFLCAERWMLGSSSSMTRRVAQAPVASPLSSCAGRPPFGRALGPSPGTHVFSSHAKKEVVDPRALPAAAPGMTEEQWLERVLLCSAVNRDWSRISGCRQGQQQPDMTGGNSGRPLPSCPRFIPLGIRVSWWPYAPNFSFGVTQQIHHAGLCRARRAHLPATRAAR